MESIYGKPIDLSRLKQNVLCQLDQQVAFWSKKARELREHTFEVKTCPICDTSTYEELFEIHGYPWRQCTHCSHVFNSRQLPQNQIASFYDETDEKINYSDTYSDPKVQTYRLENVARPKVDFVKLHQPPPKRWLDVGCGNGGVIHVAGQQGYQAIGIEPNPRLVKYAREVYGVEVHQTSLEAFAEGKDASFEVVSFLGLLDLVPNPMEFLRTAHRLLVGDGVLFASFPNFDSLSTVIQATYADQVICRHMYPSVINVYTLRSIQYALEQVGFEPITCWFFGMDIHEMLVNLSLADSQFCGSRVHKMLGQYMNELQLVFDKAQRCDKFHLIVRKVRETG